MCAADVEGEEQNIFVKCDGCNSFLGTDFFFNQLFMYTCLLRYL